MIDGMNLLGCLEIRLWRARVVVGRLVRGGVRVGEDGGFG